MSSAPLFSLPPSLADIDAIVRAEIAALPPSMAQFVADLVVMVEDFPSEDVEREMKLESPFDLLGLYQGASVEGRMSSHLQQLPDMIFIYRRPLLDFWCKEEDDLTDLVRHVVVHEIGHHFGFSDAEMDALTS